MTQTLPSNLWESQIIKDRLILEANFDGNRGIPKKPHFWVLVPHADTKNGSVILKNFDTTIEDIEPHPMQQDFARGLQEHLMKEASFDGLWIVGWTHPPTSYGVLTEQDNVWNRLIFIWLDKDGDPQYTLESELPVINIISHGIDYYINLAHKTHEQWNEIYGNDVLKSDMMLKDEQQKKAVLESL